MHRLQELVRLYRLNTGVRERARMLGMSTRTERAYRTALGAAGLLEGDADDLPELDVLCAVVEAGKPPPPPRRVTSSVDQWLPEIRAGVKNGAGPTAIWDRLNRTDEEFKGSLSAVKRAVKRIKREQGVKAADVAIPVDTDPGDVAQVDFGYAGRWFDPATGRVRKAWVFVMILGYSRHMFAKLVFDQKAITWVTLHIEAFDWFGGVPRTIVPDNLKAAVIRSAFGVSDRHQLALNRTYRELARHYGFKVDPTPVRSPQKKGKVESGVKYVVRNFLAAADFETVAAANADLPDWLLKTAGMRTHGTTGQRPLEVFAEERGSFLPLPTAPYEPVVWKQATVHRDSHVQFERRLYSVPWPHIGARVWVKATPASVLIYAQDQRIATHVRDGSSRRSTHTLHLPEHRAELAERSIDYWVERADGLGEIVGTYVRNVVASDTVLSKLRDVQAIVTLLERYPQRRSQAACRRADYFGNYTYLGVRRILDNALDLEPLPSDAPAHGHLAQPRFARAPRELLAPAMEEARECH
jgi:transposase